MSWSPGDERPEFRKVRKAGLDGLLLTRLSAGGEEETLGDLKAESGSAGLKLLADIELDSFAIDHPLVGQSPQFFTIRRQAAGDSPVDPRRPGPATGEARARLKDPDVARAVLPFIEKRLKAQMRAGADGFRIRRSDCAPPDFIADLVTRLRKSGDVLIIADGSSASRDAVSALRGIDGIASSFAFWDLAAPWLEEEFEALRLTAPLLSEIEPKSTDGARNPAEVERLMMAAALMGQGLIVSYDLLARHAEAVKRSVELSKATEAYCGEMRLIRLGSAVTAILRTDGPDVRTAENALLGLINRAAVAAAVNEPALLSAVGAGFQPFRRAGGRMPCFAPLAPAEVRIVEARRAKPVAAKHPARSSSASEAAARPRLVVEQVRPQVDGGDFPAKRTVGEAVSVEAVFFGDGHEQLAAELRWRAIDEKEWRTARMEERGNDRWTASFPLDRIGRYEFQVEGWLDRFGGFRRDYRKKLDAGVAQHVDFQEGRNLVEEARGRSQGDLGKRLADFLKRIDTADERHAPELLLDAELALLMDDADERPFAVRSGPRLVESERLQARYSSWYELFPRSQTDDPQRHGTFEDVIARLPQIRAMGFDTLYFPPIHPIGRKHRKGPNNTLTPGPDDPGSPYAIGSDEGGHKAIHPQLGTIEDFRRLVDEARRHGMEIALDFAIQCSPDHPWLEQHPGWFDWRPDGTIKYAENPPKKYQDIVNVDFYRKEAIPGLWLELRDTVLFWIEQGVKTFRVDNPHTKPFPFWEWMIGDIRSVHPDVIFLSEAFTRPAVMYWLAKIGFSQSYTYFTWRNSKKELTDYLIELTQSEAAEFFRPHFFVNTPDINPTFLHTSGRAGFQIRAALAATLSGLFGVYSGFELCEAQPVPGKEEYWESEKFEVKPRDWQAPGNIIEDIARLNRLRRAFPALQSHLGLSFYNAWNDQILYYGKRSPGTDEIILVAVSLDPHNPQEAEFEVPLWEWGIGDDGSIAVEDLVGEHRFAWTGKVQHVRLTPDRPYSIWRISPAGEKA